MVRFDGNTVQLAGVPPNQLHAALFESNPDNPGLRTG
jgi:hypothetical protein